MNRSLVMVGKAQRLGEGAVLAKVDRTRICRQKTTIEHECDQPAILCVPPTCSPVRLLKCAILFPRREIECVIDKDLEPKNPAAASALKSLLNRVGAKVGRQQAQCAVLLCLEAIRSWCATLSQAIGAVERLA